MLGIRIEVFDSNTRAFLTPYYVFLNRPHGEDGLVKVHKHTLPPHVGLKNFVHKYLPVQDSAGLPKQDLIRFARAVRKELVAHQKRLGAISRLAKEAGLGGDKENAEVSKMQQVGITSIKETDLSAMELEITWSDGATGRIQLGKDGSISRAAVRTSVDDGSHGVGKRLRQREARILAGDGRVEGIVDRLAKEHEEMD